MPCRDKSLQEAGEKDTMRTEAFSDGVFAIAITLLVLDLKVPPLHLLSEGKTLASFLKEQWHAYLAFTVAFANILIMWVCHHNIFTRIKKTDGVFMYINGLLLFTVTIMPFSASLLSEYIRTPHAGIAGAVFAGTIFLNCLSFNLLWNYASWRRRLVGKDIHPQVIREIRNNGFIGLPFYIAAVFIAFFSPFLSIAICTGMAVFFAVKGTIQHLGPGEK